ncbi:hypothetical protein NST02_04910 [Robertmurraya sp. FSL W8-0741]|uniref:hypothetical protein n=1 Tax=Robertmurraya sp. FSL W8-0741 TaxID=2954629 RepID=UPI0030F99592
MANKHSSKAATFSKTQILSSVKFKERRDLLTVLLKDEHKYSLKEVHEEMEKFMKKRVK